MSQFMDKIIKPILALRPKNMDEDNYLSWVFSTNSRIISAYRVFKATDLPGAVDDDTASRKLIRGKVVWCRTDDRRPNLVEVEHRENVFRLTRSQWDRLRAGYLRPLPNQEDL